MLVDGDSRPVTEPLDRINKMSRLFQLRFNQEAELLNDDPEAPFIVWKAMNRQPEDWVALAKATIAQELIEPKVNLDLVGFVPRSATWERAPVMKQAIFDSQFPQILKRDQITDEQFEHIVNQWLSFSVSSYTRNRQADGSRGTEAVYFDPQFLGAKNVLLFEDVVAEGGVVISIASILKKEFGANFVGVVATMSKGPIQGGDENVMNSGVVDAYLPIMRVESVDVNDRSINLLSEPAQIFWANGYGE